MRDRTPKMLDFPGLASQAQSDWKKSLEASECPRTR